MHIVGSRLIRGLHQAAQVIPKESPPLVVLKHEIPRTGQGAVPHKLRPDALLIEILQEMRGSIISVGLFKLRESKCTAILRVRL